MPLKKNRILLVVLLLTAFFSFTQTETEVKVKADALFKNKEYVEATPLYLRLLSLQPKSYEYSYKYGTCLLFSSGSKQEAIRYLAYAVKSPVPIFESHFFLGKAYHLNYQFNDAIREYNSYLVKAPKGEYTDASNRNIAMCENGKHLLTTVTDVIVRKKTEIRQEDFFRLYDLSEIGGSIIFAVDFQSKNDKKFNHKPVVHISPDMDNVYFSSYGEGNNLDLYVARRLPGGKFGVPQKLNGGVNTPFDEDFPYMHPNGKELYFSSKGHNSMGGYDIFRAKFNAENNSFGEVENVDFSISSPDDDILYVVDKESKNAYFSSKRQSQDGKIVVYKVAVERIPVQLAIVKGSFHSSVLPGNPTMTVEVVDKASGKRIGIFSTLKENTYLITFPKGGKYEYRVQVDGSREQFTAEVEIPYLKELRPLKQRIDHELADATERIRVTNLFNEEFEDAQSIVSQVLKERANLNVNEDQFESGAPENETRTRAVIAELRLENRSLMEVGQLLELKAAEAKATTDGGTQAENKANGISAALYNEITGIDNEIRALIKEADASESIRRKEMVLNNAKELYQTRDEKLQKILEIQQAASEMSTSGNSIQDPDRLEQISNEYNRLFEEGKHHELGTLLENNKDYLLKSLHSPPGSGLEELLAQQADVDTQIKKYQSLEQGHTEEMARLDAEITALNRQKEQVKEKQKQDIQNKIDDKSQQKEASEKSLDKVRVLIKKEAEKREEITKKILLANEIEAYTGKPLSGEELSQIKATVNEDKSRILKSYIESSLAELSSPLPVKSNETMAEQTIEHYNTRSEEIYSRNEWSNYEKQSRLLSLNAEKQQELTTYLEEIDTNEKLDDQEKTQEKTAAQKMLRQLQEDQSSLEKEFEQTTKKEISGLKTERIISGIFPEYYSSVDQVKASNNLSRVEKLERLNQLDSDLSQKITAEIQQLKKEIQPTTRDPLAEAKIDLLHQHNTHIQSSISAQKEEINSLKTAQESRTRQEQETDQQISRIAEATEEKYTSLIGEYNKLSGAENPAGAIAVLEELTRELNTQKQELEQARKTHPNTTKINSQLTVIEHKMNEVSMLLATERTAQEAFNSRQTVSITSNDPAEEEIKNDPGIKPESSEEITREEPTQQEESLPTAPVKSEAEIKQELHQDYSVSTDDFEKTDLPLSAVRRTIDRLETYKSQLEHRLNATGAANSETGKAQYQTVIREEIARTTARIAELLEEEQTLSAPPTAEENNTELPNSEETIGQQQTGTTSPAPSREQELAALLTNEELSKNERKELTRELSTIKQEKATTNTTTKQQRNIQLEKELRELTQHSDTRELQEVGTNYNAAIDRLNAAFNREKDPVNREIIASQMEALHEGYLSDLERNNRLNENLSVSSQSSGTRIYSQENLHQMQRKGYIEIDELILLKAEKSRQLNGASGKEKASILQEIRALDEWENLLRKEMIFIEEQLQLYRPVERPVPLAENTVRLSFNEERHIAASENYHHYAAAIATQNERINQHAKLTNTLAGYQEELESLRNTGESQPQQKQALFEKINAISLSLKELETTISVAHKEAVTYLPTDPEEMMKFQNLVMRGVNPVKKSLIATALIQIPASGIAFNPSPPSIPELKTIPVGVASPKGLVYRVQVGAFARPIPEDHFKEFAPVSGEKIEHSNITRYMAGYFNNAASVVDARDKIRQIGYNDAFVVAYCDGKRITFGEARRMEERNECVGQRTNELQLEVAGNFAEKLGLEDTSRTLKPVPEHSYNQSPGAAPATAIEQFDSNLLFYTVQVGVYNRPVEKERLLSLEPLYTLRLENGQIRYSAGMYGDLSEARQSETAIRAKGISDAFVTAYYQGKRISIDKARMLLASGQATLYSDDKKDVAVSPAPDPVQTVQEIKVFTESTLVQSKEKPVESYVQFATKVTFESYPREELNRYNAKGNFYYDQADRKIKSAFYPVTESLPRIAAFSGLLDTIQLSKSDVLKSNDSKVTFELNSATIPGDLNDWLMKFPYRKSVSRSENGLEIHIFDVRLEDAQEMRTISGLFGYPLTETQNLKEYDRNNE